MSQKKFRKFYPFQFSEFFFGYFAGISMKKAQAETLKLQIGINGPFFDLNFLSLPATLNKKDHFGRALFSDKNFFFQKFPSKFCISHPFSYPNIIFGLKVDFTPGYDPSHMLCPILTVIQSPCLAAWRKKIPELIKTQAVSISFFI